MPRTFLESLYKLDGARRCSHGWGVRIELATDGRIAVLSFGD